MLAALLAPSNQSGVSRLSRHREWEPKYTDLKREGWRQTKPPILSLPVFGEPVEVIEEIVVGEPLQVEEIFEETEVVNIPAFLAKQERVSELRVEPEELLLEDEEWLMLLAMMGEI